VVRALLLAGLLASAASAQEKQETPDDRFATFGEAYLGAGLSRLTTNPRTPDMLRARFFLELLRAEIPKSRLSVENQIDFEILETKLAAVVDGYGTFGPEDATPTSVLPPRGFLKLLLTLGAPSTFLNRLESASAMKGADGVGLEWSDSNDEAVKHADALLGEMDEFGVCAVLAAPEGTVKLAGVLRDFRERLAAYRERISGHKAAGRAPPRRRPTARERYQYALKYTLLTMHTPESLLDLAMTAWDDTVARLEACAKRIDGRKTWRELIEECKGEAWSKDDCHGEAEKLALKARDFALEKGLVTIPEAARDFAVVRGRRGEITPFGHYEPGAGSRKGAYVTPPLEGLSDELLRERLRDNNKYWTTIVALHEAVPGHHLQFEVAKDQKRSRIRRMADTSTYVEGWGLYTEEMMFLNGYYEDGTRQRLTALKMRLWRCARVVIDVGLQTGTMTKEEAVKLLVEGVTLEPSSAKAEVDHYVQRPTYFCGYLLGFTTFMDLREGVRSALGDKFDQRAFHDAILAVGPMPLPLLKRAVMSRLTGR
jgi:hypothetical protein